MRKSGIIYIMSSNATEKPVKYSTIKRMLNTLDKFLSKKLSLVLLFCGLGIAICTGAIFLNGALTANAAGVGGGDGSRRGARRRAAARSSAPGQAAWDDEGAAGRAGRAEYGPEGDCRLAGIAGRWGKPWARGCTGQDWRRARDLGLGAAKPRQQHQRDERAQRDVWSLRGLLSSPILATSFVVEIARPKRAGFANALVAALWRAGPGRCRRRRCAGGSPC